MKEISRQRRWQLKRQRLGLCITCGGAKGASKMRQCFACSDRRLAAQRRKREQ